MSRNHVEYGLYSKRWRRLRKRILARDGYRCTCGCKRGGRLEVDHIIPVDQGGDPWNEENLQTLRRSCHIEKTRRENTRLDPEREKWRRVIVGLT